MKKLLLAALALLGLAAPNLARAYDFITVAPPVTSLTDGCYYFIYDAHSDDGSSQEVAVDSNHRYAFRFASADTDGSQINGTHIKPENAWNNGANNVLNSRHVWKAISTGSGTWKFQNAANDKFITAPPSASIGTEANAASLVLEATNQSGTFKVKQEGTDNKRWDGNDGDNCPMVYYGGDGHPIRFYEALSDDNGGYKFDEIGGWNVTFTYPTYKEGATYSTTARIIDGDNAAAHIPAVEFFSSTSLATEDAIVSETNKNFTVNGTWNFPIEANHVYRMRLRPAFLTGNATQQAQCKFMHFGGNEADVMYEGIEETDFSTDFFWYFTAGEMNSDGLIPVQLHGMSMPAGEGLEFSTADNSAGHQSANPTVWYIRSSNVATSDEKDFILQHSEEPGTFINHRSGKVATWYGTNGVSLATAKGDDGCVFRAYELLASDWDAIAKGDATEDEINAAKADPSVSNVKALIAKMSVPAADVQAILTAADSFLALGLTGDDDLAQWTADKAAYASNVNKVNPMNYALLSSALNSLVYNTSIHIPAEGKQLRFRHTISADEKHLGIKDGALSCNAQEGKSVFTLTPFPGSETSNPGFFLYNEYAGQYVVNHSTMSSTQATVYILDLFSDLTNPTYGIRTANGSGPIYLHNNGENDYLDTSVMNEGAQWTLEAATADQAANEYLAGAKEFNKTIVDTTNSGNVGLYTLTDAGHTTLETYMAVTTTNTIEEKRTAGNILRNLTGIDKNLNMPTPGHIYEFAKADKSKYISCENGTTNSATMVNQTAQNLFSTLFYLDDQQHLVALEDGKVLGKFSGTDKNAAGGSWSTVLLETIDETTNELVTNPLVGKFTFGEAALMSKYTICTQDSRYLYNAHADVDAGGSANEEGYYWTIIDKGEYTPIPGTNENRTTVLLPFAMYRKSEMTFYTAKEKNGKLILTEFTDQVIPANVPFMLDMTDDVERDADNHLVYLQKANTEGNVPAENDLCGSIYAKTNTDFATRSGNHFAPETAAIVKGFHAHFHGNKIYTISNPQIEAALDNLEGKVFALKNNNDRGYIGFSNGQDAIWTSGKAGLAADGIESNPDYHWTLVKDTNGVRYLYNLAAKKFAACYTPTTGPSHGDTEFVWHFSDYPTAIDFCFFDYDQTTDLATATFNIIGGERSFTQENHAGRPAGIQIIEANTYPVVGISGHSADDGCGFNIIMVENATPGEVASADAALEAMEAEHAAALDYIANRTDDHADLPGHYNADGYTAFSAAMPANAEAAPADTQAKYYQLVRARNAAGANITEFADGQAYEIEGMYAAIYWKGQQFYVDVEPTNTGAADAYSNIWVCSKEGDNVNFTHTYTFESGVTGEQIDKPAAVRRRAADATGAAVSMFDTHSAPNYVDGMGTVTVADKNVKVNKLAQADEAVTTGIEEITSAANVDATVYDLQGRRVNRATRGLYIINGQKTLRK